MKSTFDGWILIAEAMRHYVMHKQENVIVINAEKSFASSKGVTTWNNQKRLFIATLVHSDLFVFILVDSGDKKTEKADIANEFLPTACDAKVVGPSELQSSGFAMPSYNNNLPDDVFAYKMATDKLSSFLEKLLNA